MSADPRGVVDGGNPTGAEADEPYVISDERLAEIRGLIDWGHCGWQTVPKPGVTVYDLAGAVDDLLAERDHRG